MISLFKNLHFLVFSLFSLCFTGAFGQAFSIDLSWKMSENINENGKVYKRPILDNGSYTGRLPEFYKIFSTKNGKWETEIVNYETQVCSSEELTYINLFDLEIPTTFSIISENKKERGVNKIVLHGVPYINDNGVFKKVTHINGINRLVGTEIQTTTKSYKTVSALNSGTWYKISVPSNGVYKLDRTFLASLGIDVANLNPNHLNVYGNGDGRLREQNNGVYYDDLEKNPILGIGLADNVFNDNDYFVFHAYGPNRWDYSSSNGFVRNQHIYSTVQHYFIHIDASDAPSRIQSVNSDPTSNVTVNTFNYHAIQEKELVNLVKGGQRFYGEEYDVTLNYSHLFSVPNIDLSTPVRIDYAVANNCANGSNTFSLNYNGGNIHTANLPTTGEDWVRSSQNFTFTATGSTIDLSSAFSRANPSFQLYLDYIELECRRNLTMSSSYLDFRDLNSIASGNSALFQLANINSEILIWDVTNPNKPFNINGNLAGSTISFIRPSDSLKEYVAFYPSAALTPTAVGQISNQNLHGLAQADYIIVTHPDFVSQSNRLADLHRANGLKVHVIPTPLIYNEFSSGNQDATAIRRFMKMFYDRANGDSTLFPKYLCLFGDATFDPKGRVENNNYMVPTFEFPNSESHIAALVTDDYFGFLDNNESFSGADMMDIGVGRILATNAQHANVSVDKIERYMKNQAVSAISGANSCCSTNAASSFGDWRMQYTIVTDDEEGGYFISIDAEPAIAVAQSEAPYMNYDKIYSDAFQQVSQAGGERYPEAFNAITSKVERGTLIMNYIGHGGEVGAAEERIITLEQMQEWSNINRLMLFVSATCEFAKFDDPERESIGELMALSEIGGAIALMTTSRSVFFGVNTGTVNQFYRHVFDRDANFDALTFGEIMRRTKNLSGTSDNRRSFNLIGDPALKIALPKLKIVTDSINGKIPTIDIDTASALSKVRISGHFEDNLGNIQTSLNGILNPTIFDKEKTFLTLGNDAGSPVIPYALQKNALYKGTASVINGYFSFEFYVPKDINYSYGKGKISYYGNTTNTDAYGFDTNIVVGGINSSGLNDAVGPEITAYLNDTRFVDGGITGKTPLLIVDMKDDFGINTVGNGIGHDITAVLDGETASPIVLNEFYVGALDDYSSGRIEYNFSPLSVGKHVLDIKVWDINNNSSTYKMNFEVTEDSSVVIQHVLNYPNPFTTRTEFMFEHNQSCSSLEAQVQIYSVSGKVVKTINETVATKGFQTEGIVWDGKDDFGDQLAKGVYIYKLSVNLPDGTKAEKTEKLVLLR